MPHYSEFDGLPIDNTAWLKPSWQTTLSQCDWCASPWVAAAAVIGAKYAGLIHSWTLVGFGIPAIAAAAGLIARWEDR